MATRSDSKSELEPELEYSSFDEGKEEICEKGVEPYRYEPYTSEESALEEEREESERDVGNRLNNTECNVSSDNECSDPCLNSWNGNSINDKEGDGYHAEESSKSTEYSDAISSEAASSSVQDGSRNGRLLEEEFLNTEVICEGPMLLDQVMGKSVKDASSSLSILKENCQMMGLKFHGETLRNGNCFFEAVSSQLQLNEGIQKSPQELRQGVINFMKANRVLTVSEGTIDLAEFTYGEDYDGYCERMARDGEWADNVVVVGMARMLRRDIMIVTSAQSSGPDRNIALVVGQLNFEGRIILLGHEWENHYRSLQTIEAISSEPVSVGVQVGSQNDGLEELHEKIPSIMDRILKGGRILLQLDSRGNLQVLEMNGEHEDISNRSVNGDDLFADGIITPEPSQTRSSLEQLLSLVADREREFPKPMIGVVLNSDVIHTENGQYIEGSQYQIKVELGKGTSGVVHRVVDNVTHKECARKRKLRYLFRSEEVMAHYECSGKGISPALYAVIADEYNVYIFMRKINGITFTDLINSNVKEQKLFRLYRPYIAKFIVPDLLGVVTIMHEGGWAHKDIYGNNLLMQVEEDGSFSTYVIDFGSAIQIQGDQNFEDEKNDYLQSVIVGIDILCDNNLRDDPANLRRGWEEELPEMTGEDQVAKDDICALVNRVLHISDTRDIKNFRLAITGTCKREVQTDKLKLIIPVLNPVLSDLIRLLRCYCPTKDEYVGALQKYDVHHAVSDYIRSLIKPKHKLPSIPDEQDIWQSDPQEYAACCFGANDEAHSDDSNDEVESADGDDDIKPDYDDDSKSIIYSEPDVCFSDISLDDDSNTSPVDSNINLSHNSVSADVSTIIPQEIIIQGIKNILYKAVDENRAKDITKDITRMSSNSNLNDEPNINPNQNSFTGDVSIEELLPYLSSGSLEITSEEILFIYRKKLQNK